jgi:hypothetical protein
MEHPALTFPGRFSYDPCSGLAEVFALPLLCLRMLWAVMCVERFLGVSRWSL